VVHAEGPVRAPADLADRAIAVKMEAGSHFATLDLLDGALPPERLRLTHVGGPLRRLEHLLDGRVAAATLMEHYVDVAVANGCRVVAAGRYPEIIAGRGDLDAETLRHFVRAVNRAIERIEADPARYLPLVYAELPPHLARPARPPRFAYVRPAAYDRRTFERTARWMQARGFVERVPRYEDVALAPPGGG
jgi:NitT/TauT family transport system substrate-binding protein